MASSTPSAFNPLAELNLPSPLILGSASFTRKLILKEMNIPFDVVVRSIDEKALGDRNGDASDLVLQLAKAKNEHLTNCIMDGDVEDIDLDGKGVIVLTGDQVVTHGTTDSTTIMEKPESILEAKGFVAKYAVSPPSTVGAVVMTHLPSRISVCGVDTSTIRFRPSVANCDLIDRLLEDDAPVMGCAGGLMVEHPFVVEHIDGIDGSQDGVMGLSKDLVMRLLKEISVSLEDNRNSQGKS
eukprot:CAMPEP_0195509550 /NCGR_PEP_ID=MMETSP0794_2-20130614/2454_1 /TAXON_ID=515487 /ORGANISM="Stephanopyxis turris, Strain CCMP 815" /LENGTH=239 /DNA_ID=CAMNT_0040636795 /DNA_START=206 /DNA_END=925 /DNA_ORIENTATION=+